MDIREAQKIVATMQRQPQQAIDTARRGSQLALANLANFWTEVPSLFDLGVIDVFLEHLKGNDAPAQPSPVKTTKTDKAYLSFLGIMKLCEDVQFLASKSSILAPKFIRAWPDIFKWSVFFAQTAWLPQSSPILKRSTADVVASAWFTFTQIESVKDVMVSTKGSLEIAARFWVDEDSPNLPPTRFDMPVASALLDAFLKKETYGPGQADNDANTVVIAAGGSAPNIAKLAMVKLRAATSAPKWDEKRLTIFLDLIGHFCVSRSHQLRNSFLGLKAIGFCAKIAVQAANLKNLGGSEMLLAVYVAALGFIRNCVQSTDGFSWVIQAIKGGFLIALADGSPHFDQLHPEDFDMIMDLLRTIMPRYMVYRSVISALDSTMQTITNPSSATFKRLHSSIVREDWVKFIKLAKERQFSVVHQRAIKGKVAACDNIKCQKKDAKNAFQACAACGNTLYCSKECQVEAWKNGGHKEMCVLKQREIEEGKMQSISKRDASFFHYLAVRDSRRHLPFLRRLAQERYPDKTHADLIIQIDYTKSQEEYDLLLLAEYEQDKDVCECPAESKCTCDRGWTNGHARNDAIISRARENPGKLSIIQSKICNGELQQLVVTVAPEGFWEDKEHWIGDDEARSSAEDPQVYESEAERTSRNKGSLFDGGDTFRNDARAQRVRGILDLFAQSIEGRSGGGPLTRRVSQSIEDVD